MDTIMEPYIVDLVADDITASMISGFSCGGGGLLQMEVADLDAYLRAVGVLPARPGAPVAGYGVAAAGEVETLVSYDAANGVLYDCSMQMDVKVPARLPPPPGFPARPVPAWGDEPVYAAPGRLPQPPGFPPRPFPAQADEPVYAAPGRLPPPPGFPARPVPAQADEPEYAAPGSLPPPPGFPPLPAPSQQAEPAYAPPGDEGNAVWTFMKQLLWSDQYDAPVSNNSVASRPQLCAPYDDEIDATLRAMEKDAAERPSPEYLKKVHGDQISVSARAALVDWMDRFTRNYDLAAGTLHRAVSYLDRFLSARSLPSYTDHQLSLLGAAAVYTAAKYDDQRTILKLNAKVIASYGGFASALEVILMENEMVAALDYRLGGPTADTFVDHFTRHSQGEEELQVQRLARDIADLSLKNYGCLSYLPSMVAAASISVARWTLKPGERPWSTELQQLTGYSSQDLVGCILTLANVP